METTQQIENQQEEERLKRLIEKAKDIQLNGWNAKQLVEAQKNGKKNKCNFQKTQNVPAEVVGKTNNVVKIN